MYNDVRKLVADGHTDEAIDSLRRLLLDHPDFALGHNDLAVLYYQTGDKVLTLGHYEKAVRLDPDNANFRKNLASFYVTEMGWFDDAIMIYTDLLRRDPTDGETLEALGIISLNVGRDEEARSFFRRLSELQPWRNDVREMLSAWEAPPSPPPISPAPVAAGSGDVDDILARLRSTVTRLEQGTTEDPYEKAGRLAEEGRIDEALEILESLLRQNPDDARAHNDLGVLYLQNQQTAKSLEHHERAVALAPDNGLYRRNLAGLCFSRLGMADEAIFLLTDFLKKHPDDIDTLVGLGQLSLEVGRPEEAKTFLADVLRLQPSNDEVRTILARLDEADANPFFLKS
jgi:Flp pilus assembly protein TadD